MLTRKDLDKMSTSKVLTLAFVQVFKYLSYFITINLIVFAYACICYSL